MREVLHRQSGVINRPQARGVGATDDDIERYLRRRQWARVHRGVYVDHTGPLTWDQRCWAAVLAHWPAALSGRAALRAHRFPGAEEPRVIEVVVPTDRRVAGVAGVRARRATLFGEMALMHLSPPRIRIEDAVVDLAAAAQSPDEAVAIVADAIGQRRTTAIRLRTCVAGRSRLRHRALLEEILDDVVEGCHSALERRYHRAVEAAHGLPRGRRQRRVENAAKRAAYRDVDYAEQATVVELDGRLGHELAHDRWADLQRDLDSILSGDLTIRLGWRQILDPCRVAESVAKILIRRGWSGIPTPCGPDCSLTKDGGRLSAPDADNLPPSSGHPAA